MGQEIALTWKLERINLNWTHFWVPFACPHHSQIQLFPVKDDESIISLAITAEIVGSPAKEVFSADAYSLGTTALTEEVFVQVPEKSKLF